MRPSDKAREGIGVKSELRFATDAHHEGKKPRRETNSRRHPQGYSG